jgi:hypothetical protein
MSVTIGITLTARLTSIMDIYRTGIKIMTKNNKKDQGKFLPSIRRKFNRLVFKAKAAIFTEAAAPRIIAPAVIGTGFLAATWAGLWTILPLEAKIIGVVAFAAAAAAAPLIIKSGSLLVRKKDAIKRLDNSVKDKNKPAETLASQVTKAPQSSIDDTEQQALYDRHVKRTWDQWGDKFKVGWPKLNLNKYDPLRLRYVLPICAAATAFHAGDNREAYLQDAFNWQHPPAPVEPLDIRAWVTPPNLAHLAPQYLDTTVYPYIPPAEGEEDRAITTVSEPSAPIDVSVHEGSILTIVVVGDDAAITVNGSVLSPSNVIVSDEDSSISSYEYEINLAEGEMAIEIEGRSVWNIDITADANPVTDILDIAPDEQNPNALRVICEAGDDIAVEGGQLILRVPGGEQNTQAGGDDAVEALEGAQLPTISLPRGRVCTP